MGSVTGEFSRSGRPLYLFIEMEDDERASRGHCNFCYRFAELIETPIYVLAAATHRQPICSWCAEQLLDELSKTLNRQESTPQQARY